jgi:ATP phosphoribosyltransferase regulatory subunit
MDAVLAASADGQERPRLYLPFGTSWHEAPTWQKKGYAVVRAVAAAADTVAEAKRLRCTHALIDGAAVPL